MAGSERPEVQGSDLTDDQVRLAALEALLHAAPGMPLASAMAYAQGVVVKHRRERVLARGERAGVAAAWRAGMADPRTVHAARINDRGDAVKLVAERIHDKTGCSRGTALAAAEKVVDSVAAGRAVV